MFAVDRQTGADYREKTEWGNPDSYVIYKGGLWRITHHNRDPDEDLRPQWGWTEGHEPYSTWTIQHCYGPAHPEGLDQVDVKIGVDEGYDFANAMEVIAYAALEDK
jgi:hypothetical protein